MIVSTAANSEVIIGRKMELKNNIVVFRDLSVMYDCIVSAERDDQQAINTLVRNLSAIIVPKGQIVVPVLRNKQVMALYVQGLPGLWFTLSSYLEAR
jgi:hypothetical protein